jgi:ATP-dependent RNA helicase RhlE
MSFNIFSLQPPIMAGISSAGYKTPTPIQIQTIPTIMKGNDVLGLAQTGTGKTAAFVLPILNKLMKGPRKKIQALILSPTRELAEQTHRSIKLLGKQTGLHSMSIYGGVSTSSQIKQLRYGVEIVVACPGRLLDLIQQGRLSLKNIDTLVLDEADQMFDMGFLPSIRRIISYIPSDRQTLLFSATMPNEIRKLATEMLHNPVTVEISIRKPIETITHAIYSIDQSQKLTLLLQLLNERKDEKILVFTRTKHRAKKLAIQLSQSGHKSTSLQGNLSQGQRDKAMNDFRTGHVKIMVATDIASRGIDVSQISQVINYDIPDTVEAYTHRTGRTGRMRELGSALSLVTKDDYQMVRAIERILGEKLERRDSSEFKLNDAIKQQRIYPYRDSNRTKKNNYSQPIVYNH